jgi:hypothetical protein
MPDNMVFAMRNASIEPVRKLMSLSVTPGWSPNRKLDRSQYHDGPYLISNFRLARNSGIIADWDSGMRHDLHRELPRVGFVLNFNGVRTMTQPFWQPRASSAKAVPHDRSLDVGFSFNLSCSPRTAKMGGPNAAASAAPSGRSETLLCRHGKLFFALLHIISSLWRTMGLKRKTRKRAEQLNCKTPSETAAGPALAPTPSPRFRRKQLKKDRLGTK